MVGGFYEGLDWDSVTQTKSWVVATPIFLMFTPKLGEDEPILTHIFQRGLKPWNHQLESNHPWLVTGRNPIPAHQTHRRNISLHVYHQTQTVSLAQRKPTAYPWKNEEKMIGWKQDTFAFDGAKRPSFESTLFLDHFPDALPPNVWIFVTQKFGWPKWLHSKGENGLVYFPMDWWGVCGCWQVDVGNIMFFGDNLLSQIRQYESFNRDDDNKIIAMIYTSEWW